MKKIFLIPLIGVTAVQAQNVKKPNVIVVLTDDLGYGDVSISGSKTISTPNIDRLGNEGINFTNGYATSATSTPSRYALLTGMYPWKEKNARILPGDAPLLISPSQYTFPKMMKEAGYATAAIGKWHLGMGDGNTDWNKKVTPGANEIGFDYSYLIAATVDRVPTVYIKNGYVDNLDPKDPIYVDYNKNFDGEPTAKSNPELMKMKWSHGHNNSVMNGIPRIGYQKGGKSAYWVDEDMAQVLVDKVDQYLEEKQNEPFFLYYGLHQPHVPRTPNSKFVGKSGMGPRGDAILEADWCVGELLADLEKRNMLENTIIFFSSDNGPVLNDGYYDDAVEKLGNHKPAGDLRGGKYSLFDAGTHVPFFVYWKSNVKHRVSDALVCQVDIMASIASLINKPLTGELDSENILPAFLGKSKKGRKELVIEANGKLAMRYENYALIPPYKGPQRNDTGNELGNLPEYGLYDLKKDVSQKENIANCKKSKMEKMKTVFFDITKGYYTPDVKEIELK